MRWHKQYRIVCGKNESACAPVIASLQQAGSAKSTLQRRKELRAPKSVCFKMRNQTAGFETFMD
jgi:hypothetical protein